jgi:hypothetical protein
MIVPDAAPAVQDRSRMRSIRCWCRLLRCYWPGGGGKGDPAGCMAGGGGKPESGGCCCPPGGSGKALFGFAGGGEARAAVRVLETE